MSDAVKCDCCGKRGRRRMGTVAPDGWSYLEATDEEEPSNVVIVYACSPECREGQWKLGPGKLDLTQAV